MKEVDIFNLRTRFLQSLERLERTYRNFYRECDIIQRSHYFQYGYGDSHPGFEIVNLPTINISINRISAHGRVVEGEFLLRIEFKYGIPINYLNAFLMLDSFALDEFPKIHTKKNLIILAGTGLYLPRKENEQRHLNPRLENFLKKLDTDHVFKDPDQNWDLYMAYQYLMFYFQIGDKSEKRIQPILRFF